MVPDLVKMLSYTNVCAQVLQLLLFVSLGMIVSLTLLGNLEAYSFGRLLLLNCLCPNKANTRTR